MPQIHTFVIFDIETTGLPYQEQNCTKITQASFLAVDALDIEGTKLGSIPAVSKLTFHLNPKRPIHPEATLLTGLTNKYLQNSPVFAEKFETLRRFLRDLSHPVCLVAHNGNAFDFKILQAECCDAGVQLDESILCVDSLIGLRKFLKDTDICYKTLMAKEVQQLLPTLFSNEVSLGSVYSNQGSEMTDDDSDNESSDDSHEDFLDTPEKHVLTKIPNSFRLADVYKRLLNKKVVKAHDSESDCFMLLECIVAMKEEFLPWANRAQKPLNEIKPYRKY